MKTALLLLLPLLITCCTKQKDEKTTAIPQGVEAPAATRSTQPTTSTFTRYTIQQGAHECDQRTLKSVSGTSMNFIAKFDSTAIYPPVITDYNHAYDVNKLYGFSEGFNNQYNCARIGWRWLDGQLQLFAYVYVKGTLLRDPVSYDPPFIKSVSIGAEVNCSIAVSGANYIFTVDGTVVKTARGTSVAKYQGYQQYPYFGGSLTAPHLTNIYIK
jgi:hypothetical protein